MKIYLMKNKSRWWFYYKPKWLNIISWEFGEPKIYQWFIWGITLKD